MDGILTLAQAAERLGVPRVTLTHALARDCPGLRVELLPAGEGHARGAWGVRVEDLERIREVLDARRGRKGWPRRPARHPPGFLFVH
jgi:hypothetical protein